MVITMDRVDNSVRFQDTDRGGQQSNGLRRLEKASGRKRSAIVAELDEALEIGHDQYRRYLRGETPLKLDQFDAFAHAFRVTTAELSRAIGLLDDEVDPALRQRAADALGPAFMREAPERATDLARELAKMSPVDQDAALRELAEDERQGVSEPS